MALVMAKFNGEYGGRVRVGRLDVDASLATVQEPTMRA
jgi:hypothetical protein